MMGIDQDDIVLAPWTTIKYRVTGASRWPNANQSAAASRPTRRSRSTRSSQLYPEQRSRASTRRRRPTQAANTPQPVRFTNIDQILVAAPLAPRTIPAAIAADHASCCASGTASGPASRTTSTSAT